MEAVAAAAAAGGSACAWWRVDGAAASRRWRRVGGVQLASAREGTARGTEGRGVCYEELGPALAAARRRCARWAMVTRCAVASRRAEAGI